jgi:hypothetical protein
MLRITYEVFAGNADGVAEIAIRDNSKNDSFLFLAERIRKYIPETIKSMSIRYSSPLKNIPYAVMGTESPETKRY